MTNLPKKITFAYDYIIKKTTKKPNAPKQKRIHLRQKSTEWSCGDTGHLAVPRGSAMPSGAVGFMLGTQGPLWDPAPALWLVPKDKQRCRGHSPNTELWALTRGLQHISGTFHGHTKVNIINIFSAKTSSCLVVKNE